MTENSQLNTLRAARDRAAAALHQCEQELAAYTAHAALPAKAGGDNSRPILRDDAAYDEGERRAWVERRLDAMARDVSQLRERADSSEVAATFAAGAMSGANVRAAASSYTYCASNDGPADIERRGAIWHAAVVFAAARNGGGVIGLHVDAAAHAYEQFLRRLREIDDSAAAERRLAQSCEALKEGGKEAERALEAYAAYARDQRESLLAAIAELRNPPEGGTSRTS